MPGALPAPGSIAKIGFFSSSCDLNYQLLARIGVGSLPSGNLFFADNHIGDSLRLVGRFNRLAGIPLITLFYVAGENPAYGKTHERLHKEHLREICERQVVAYQAEPTAEKVNDIEPIVIGIVEDIGLYGHREHRIPICGMGPGLGIGH